MCVLVKHLLAAAAAAAEWDLILNVVDKEQIFIVASVFRRRCQLMIR